MCCSRIFPSCRDLTALIGVRDCNDNRSAADVAVFGIFDGFVGGVRFNDDDLATVRTLHGDGFIHTTSLKELSNRCKRGWGIIKHHKVTGVGDGNALYGTSR